jgi:hypothetical protein
MKTANETVANIPEKSSSVSIHPEHKCRLIRRLEFFNEVWIETTRDIPSYYVVERDDNRVKVRIGVSLELTQKRRIKDSTEGKLFYPIAISDGMTGNQFSINAPFTLDTVRSGLAPQDELNDLLLKEAASFAAYLCRNVLVSKFGPSSYLLLKQTSNSNQEIFLEKLHNEIRSQKCVLNNKYAKGSKIDSESMFCQKDLYLPCRTGERNGVKRYHPAKDLYGFIGDERCMTCEIEDIELRGLFVSKMSAEPFTIHDVVCLKVNDYVLRSQGQFEGWRFKTKEAFDKEMLKERMQRKYANAINNHFKELSDEERVNLKASYSWLCASGRLRPLAGKDQLFRWEGKLPEFPGFDIDDLLHPCISSHPVIERLHVASYDVNKSLLSATMPKLERGELDEDKKKKLLGFIVDNASKLSNQVIKALKKQQIFLDSKGRFVEFDRLVKASKSEAEIFGDAISIPCEKLFSSRIFLKRFRIRKRVNDDDIITRVDQLCGAKDATDKNELLSFEAYLNKRKISSRVVNYLKEVFVVLCTDNTIASPSAQIIYYETKRIRSLVGNGALYAKGNFKRIFGKLGVRFQPFSDDIYSFIVKLRETDTPPPDRSSLYTELAKALLRDGKSLGDFQDDRIVYLESTYHRPKDVFLSTTFRGVLLGSKAYLKAKGKFHQSLIDLGCKLEPCTEDYIDFLRWVSSRLQEGLNDSLREKYVLLIHHAYSNLSSSDGINLDDNVILTYNGQMVSRKEILSQHVYIDDYPELSGKIQSDKIPIWFADCGQEGYNFMRILQVPKLSESATLVEVQVKTPQTPADGTTNLLLRLKSDEVINAIRSIVQQNDEWRRDLRHESWEAIVAGAQHVKTAESIQKTLSITNYRFSVDAGCALDGDTLYFLKGLKPSEMRDTLAIEISRIVLKTKHHQSSLGDAIYRFLEGDIIYYLNSRGYVYEKSLKRPEPEPEPAPASQVPKEPPKEISQIEETGPEKAIVEPPLPSLRDEDRIIGLESRSDQTDTKLEDWAPECTPEQADLENEEYLPKEKAQRLLTRDAEGGTDLAIGNKPASPVQEKKELAVLSQKAKYAIGRWGEEYALRCLKEEKTKEHQIGILAETERGFTIKKDGQTVVEVTWLNKYEDCGRGYDIELVENGIMYYIEVKSTKTDAKDWFDLSRDQWELMNEKKERYVVYRVYSSGTKLARYVRIRNPAQLWQEGHIAAYPVRIQL